MTDPAMDHYSGMEGVEYCPVSIGARLIGDRWSLLIVRELLQGATRFSEIHRGLPTLSKSLLSSRLRALVKHGLVEQRNDRVTGSYHLTPAGEGLRDIIVAVGAWTVQWRFPAPNAAVADSPLLLWRMFQALRVDRLPPRRVTVEFTFSDAEPNRGWLILDGAESSLCMEPPGNDADVMVEGSVEAWLAVWFGHRTYADAVDTRALVLTGTPQLTTDLHRWFDPSVFAASVTAARAKRVDRGPDAD